MTNTTHPCALVYKGCKRLLVTGVVCPVCCHYASLGQQMWDAYLARGCEEEGRGGTYTTRSDRETKTCTLCGETWLSRVIVGQKVCQVCRDRMSRQKSRPASAKGWGKRFLCGKMAKSSR